MIRHTFSHRHFAFSFELHYLLLLLSSALSLRRCCAIVTVLTHRANGGAGHCYPMEVQTTATPLTSFSSGLQCIDSSTLLNPLYPLPGFEDWRGDHFFLARFYIFFCAVQIPSNISLPYVLQLRQAGLGYQGHPIYFLDTATWCLLIKLTDSQWRCRSRAAR